MIKTFPEKLEKIYKQPSDFGNNSGYQIRFLSEPKQKKPPNPTHLKVKEESLVDVKCKPC